MLKDNPSVTNVTAPFTQRSLSQPKILDVAINRATNLIFRKNRLYCRMSERSRTMVRRGSEGGDRGDFNKNQLEKQDVNPLSFFLNLPI